MSPASERQRVGLTTDRMSAVLQVAKLRFMAYQQSLAC